nr:hypothetical protein GCM10025732_49170 [Glycomyces mayteni]
MEVESIRQSLERYERLGRFLEAAPIDPTPIPELKGAVNYCWLAFEKGHYPVVARSLIQLLRDTPSPRTGPSAAPAPTPPNS